MSSQLIPDINAAGLFVLKAPFNALIPPQTRYSVRGIRKLSEIVASGVDPFSLYYETNGVSQDEYNADLFEDISIVSLCSQMGQWIYVPSNRIISYPDVNGVVYTSMILGVSLGAIADTTPLDALKTSISNLVKDQLGISCDIKEVAVSVASLIPTSQHIQIENARSAIKAANLSDRAKLAQASTKLVAATKRIIDLEKYIKTKGL